MCHCNMIDDISLDKFQVVDAWMLSSLSMTQSVLLAIVLIRVDTT